MSTSLESLIKIAIADDHKIFRDGIKMALSDKKNLKMLWEAEDGKDMMHKIAIKQPDVLLMDIRMPEIDGINAIELIRKEYGELKSKLADKYPTDIDSYGDGKEDFVKKIEKEALKWHWSNR